MTKTRVARLTSNILNPFLVSSLVIMLIAAQASDTWLEALKWTVIPILLSILPVLVIVLYLVRKGTLESIFINARKERNRIYFLATGCTIVSAIALSILGAPPVLMAAFITGLASVIVFTFINLLWKISVHTAFMAASVTVLIILFGSAFSLTALLVPLTGWARIELKRHSLAQVVSGAVLATVICFVVFYSSGLV